MKTVKKTLVILLAIVFTAATGCGGNTGWVYEYEGKQVSAGLYINYIMTALSDLETADYDASSDQENYSTPKIKDFLKLTTSEGLSYSDQAKAEAARLSAEYLAVEKRFDELGLSLTDEELQYADYYVEYAWSSMGEQFETNGISKESIRLYQINNIKKNRVFSTMYGRGGERAIGDDELKPLFQEDYAKIEVMYVAVETNEDGSENAESKALAEDIFQRYKNGESIEELDYEYRMNIATDEEKETVTKKETGGNETIVSIADSTDEDKLYTAISSAAEGVPIMVEDASVYYIFTKKNLLEDPTDFEDYRESILIGFKQDEFNSYVRELGAGISVTANQAAISRYTPEKVKTAE